MANRRSPNKVKVAAWVPIPLRDLARAKAERQGDQMTAVIRSALETYVEGEK